MEEFNKKFNDLAQSLPDTITPPEATILIHYIEAFNGEICYQLRDKDPCDLKTTHIEAIMIDKNM